VKSLCEKAGLGKLSKTTASRICTELRERFEQFKRRDLYDVQVAALFLDAVFLAVRPDGPRRACWSPGALPRTASACCWGCASRTRTGSRSAAT
jgi:Transposase, Mutator family